MEESHFNFRSWFSDILDGGTRDSADPEDSRKVMLLNAVSASTIVFSIMFSILSGFKGNYFFALFDMALVGFVVVNILYVRATKRVEFSCNVTILVMGLFFLILFFTGGVGNTGHLWAYCYPPMVFYFVGARRGGVVVGSFYAILLAGLFIPNFPFMNAGYSSDTANRFAGSYLAIIVVSWLYELARSNSYARNLEQTRQLTDALDGLAEANQRVKESEERFRDIVFSSSDVIWETDAGGYYQYLGGRVAEVLGYDPDELLGRPLVELEATDSSTDIRALFWDDSVADENAFQITHWVRNKNGHRVCVHTTGLAFKSAGKLVGYRGVDTDITDQQQAEREREALQARLQAAQKMEAIGQLAGGIAHDFNNILGAISGYADMIRQRFGGQHPKLIKYSEMILSAATRAADLTSKLLAFARKGSAQIMVTDMDSMLRDLVQLLGASFDKHISVEYHGNATVAAIHADPSQMHEVLMNLAVNGRDAMPEGGRLVFETDNADLSDDFISKHHYQIEPGTYLVISISDSGEGMNSEVKQHLFEPFFSTKSKGTASGMGLASVYGIVKSHGGGINVYSEPSRGTTVKLYLPLAPTTAAKTEQPVQLVASAGHARILIIDDEQFMLDISSEMLEAMGFTCRVFDNGADAIAYFERHREDVDLIVVDMVMGDMSGEGALQRIRALDREIPVILSSGFALSHEREELLAKGFSEIIQKPFIMQKLGEVVARALNG